MHKGEVFRPNKGSKRSLRKQKAVKKSHSLFHHSTHAPPLTHSSLPHTQRMNLIGSHRAARLLWDKLLADLCTPSL